MNQGTHPLDNIKFNKWFDRNWQTLVTKEVLDSADYEESQTRLVWEHVATVKEFSKSITTRFNKWYKSEGARIQIEGVSLHVQSQIAWGAAEKALK
jgi:hypothetical protein